MKVRAQSSRVRPARWNPFPFEPVPDRYKQPGATPRLAACPACHAVLMRGRWTWRSIPPGAAVLMCPACQRIADRVPAGKVELSGAFEAAHRQEILALVRHREVFLRAEHPLERVISIESDEQGTHIATTGLHIARDLGNAVHHAYRGRLGIDYRNAETELHVRWQRD